MKRLLLICLFFGLLFPVVGHSVSAQDGGNCRAQVLLALSRSGSACNGLLADQACVGNGLVSAVLQPGVDPVAFTAPGDRAPADALLSLQIGPADEWSVALLQLRADLPVMEQRSVSLLAFGQVEIANQVPPVPQVSVSAVAVMVIRAAPQDSAAIIKELGLRETVIANGRTADNNWVRVIIPGTTDLGWVSTGVITAQEPLSSLNSVDETTPYLLPFQAFTLRTGADDALCPDTAESGLLLQTPSQDTTVTLTINEVPLRLAATVFLQASPDQGLIVNVLDGYVQSGPLFIPAGARAVFNGDIPAAAEPYTWADVAALPINNLPYHFALIQPLSSDQIVSLAAEYFAPTPTPLAPEMVEQHQRCTRRLQENVNLWAGPGTFYEVINTLPAGTIVYPVLQTTDADGQTWWQLSNSGWIQPGVVEAAGDCPPVPISANTPAPTYNHLSMETCMTTNGPIRPGQFVTIEFVPPAWATLQEAQQAPRISRGRISVGSTRVQVSASDPIKIADERYIVSFSGEWTAEAGTFRIESTRLSYTLICHLTVPLGN